MKATTSLLGLLGLAAALAAGGCASLPQSGDLVYYDAGAIWGWRDGFGWDYLGYRNIRIAHNHIVQPVHAPLPVHSHPPGVVRPAPGSPVCYFFFAKDGSVLRSDDGTTFWAVGHLGADEQFLPGGAAGGSPIAFHGSFSGGGGAFHLASSPTAAVRRLAGGLIGGTGSANGPYRSSAVYNRGGNYYNGANRSSGSGGYRSGGEGRSFSGGGGRSFSGGGGGGSGGGNRGGGGGGGSSNRQR